MGFTTPCFIRKNTKELRDKLKALGYQMFDNEMNGECLRVSPPDKDLFCSLPLCLSLSEKTCSLFGKEAIDCKINEELLLSIAALRDDTDCNQWFWYKDKLFKCLGGGSTVLMNGDHSIKLENKPGYFDVMKSKLKKATVKELIEHFKI